MPAKKTTRTTKPASPKPAAKSPVRKTTLPKPAPQAEPRVITHEMIARRAYEIWQSGTGGSEYDNWIRAEHELRG
jgi:hypothetical protein